MFTDSDILKLDSLIQKRLDEGLQVQSKGLKDSIEKRLDQQSKELKTYVNQRLDQQSKELKTYVNQRLDQQSKELKDYMTDGFTELLDSINDLFKEHQEGKLYPHRFQIST